MSIFSGVGANTSFEEALRLLALIEDQSKAEAVDKGEEDQQDNVVTLRRQLRDLQVSWNLMNSLLDKVFESNSQDMDGIKQMAAAACKDYRSAVDLTTFYSKEWFSRLFVTLDAKAEFANYLLELVAPYTKSNTECWQMIRDNDPRMLNFISVPHQDAS